MAIVEVPYKVSFKKGSIGDAYSAVQSVEATAHLPIDTSASAYPVDIHESLSRAIGASVYRSQEQRIVVPYTPGVKVGDVVYVRSICRGHQETLSAVVVTVKSPRSGTVLFLTGRALESLPFRAPAVKGLHKVNWRKCYKWSVIPYSGYPWPICHWFASDYDQKWKPQT